MLDLPQSMKDAQNKRRQDRAQFYAKRARQKAEKKDSDPLRQKTDKKKDGKRGKSVLAKGKSGKQKSKQFIKGGNKGFSGHDDQSKSRSKKNGAATNPNKRQKANPGSKSTKKTDHRSQLR